MNQPKIPKINIYYIGDKQGDEIYAYIHTVFDYNDNTITIVDLQSMIEGKGYGTGLLIHACKQAMIEDIDKIVLDDCSDNYRLSRNIYTKLGIKYESEHGPEMVGKTSVVASHFSKVVDSVSVDLFFCSSNIIL